MNKKSGQLFPELSMPEIELSDLKVPYKKEQQKKLVDKYCSTILSIQQSPFYLRSDSDEMFDSNRVRLTAWLPKEFSQLYFPSELLEEQQFKTNDNELINDNDNNDNLELEINDDQEDESKSSGSESPKSSLSSLSDDYNKDYDMSDDDGEEDEAVL